MKKNGVNMIAATLAAVSMLITGISPANTSFAAKKASVNLTKKCDIKKGSKKTLKLKISGAKVVKATWKSSKKNVAKITKSSKKKAVISGLKKGSSIVSVNLKYKAGKVFKKKLKCKVTVSEAVATTAPANNLLTPASNTQTPVSNTQTPATSAPAVPTDTPKPTRTPGPVNLLSALGDYVHNVGSCIAYNTWGGDSPLDNADVKAYIKENLNSLTAENEMKPEGILGGFQANLIKPSEAKAQGYIIPDDYKETNVPSLNYNNIDTLMKFESDNNIRIRYHGLIWHEQTPNWFFRKNYNPNSDFVTPEVMDARLEYYIKNVIKHICESKYSNTVYCYDVVNEFFHMTECIYRITDGQQDKTDNVKCFYNVYKGDIFEDPSSPSTSKVVDNPKYVKKCFKWAHEMLDQYGLTDSVELVYNDYDTNFEDVRSSILAVTKYINEKDDINPNGDKLVTTVGMQTHDNLEGKYLVKDHKATIDAIKAAGLNVQVTEMDLALRTATKEEQLKYWSDFTRMLIDEAKSGANITGFTWWGLADKNSWLGESQSPLLCGSSVKDKKAAYYTVINTAYATTID